MSWHAVNEFSLILCRDKIFSDLFFPVTVFNKVNNYLSFKENSARAAGNFQTRQRVPGKGKLKEQVGFLVSRSLTLPSAPLCVRGVI